MERRRRPSFRRKKRPAIISSVSHATIPGVSDGSEGELVQARDVPAVIEEKSRAALILGSRGLEHRHADQIYRDMGIPIFDRDASKSQLHDLIRRGRG